MSLELTIVTPQGQAYQGDVRSVVLPGSEGDFGVLEHHERFLSPLQIGGVDIDTGSEHLWAAIADGFAEVHGSQVTVLVESCELSGEIDTARAQLARDRAEQGLAQLDRDEDAERYQLYEAALARAINRLSVSQKRSGT